MTDQRPSGTPRLEVVEAGEAHSAAIAEFIRAVWSASATGESVAAARRDAAAANVAEPGAPPPTWIALQQGKVLGYVTTIPARLWDGHRDCPAYLIKGLMVLPEFQRGPLGFLLMKAAAARLPRSAGLAVAPAARRLFEALGYADFGAIPNWVRPVAPGRIARRLDLDALGFANLPRWAAPTLRLAQRSGLATVAGWTGGVAIRALAATLRLPAARFATSPFDPSVAGPELNELWRAAREGFPAALVRDADHLLGRYAAGPRGTYAWVAARERGKLAGVAIVRRPRLDGDGRLRGIRVAVLADLLFPAARPAVGLALLGEAERTAGRLGADAILASLSAPTLWALLRRQCYLPIAGNVHFLFRDTTGEAAGFGRTVTDWWLTRGDGLADEVF